MKKVILTILLGGMMLTLSANLGEEGSKGIRSQLIEKIGFLDLKKSNIKEEQVDLTFSFNDCKELKVIDLKSDNSFLTSFVSKQIKGSVFNIKEEQCWIKYHIVIKFKLL